MKKLILFTCISFLVISCNNKRDTEFQTWASKEVHEWIIKQNPEILNHPVTKSPFKLTNELPVFAMNGDTSNYQHTSGEWICTIVGSDGSCWESRVKECVGFNASEHVNHTEEVYASTISLSHPYENEDRFIITLSVNQKCDLCGPCSGMISNFIFIGKEENGKYIMTSYDENKLAQRLK